MWVGITTPAALIKAGDAQIAIELLRAFISIQSTQRTISSTDPASEWNSSMVCSWGLSLSSLCLLNICKLQTTTMLYRLIDSCGICKRSICRKTAVIHTNRCLLLWICEQLLSHVEFKPLEHRVAFVVGCATGSEYLSDTWYIDLQASCLNCSGSWGSG